MGCDYGYGIGGAGGGEQGEGGLEAGDASA